MHRNKLSLSGAADAWGISCRLVSNCRAAHQAIPRSLRRAFLGWEAEHLCLEAQIHPYYRDRFATTASPISLQETRRVPAS